MRHKMKRERERARAKARERERERERPDDVLANQVDVGRPEARALAVRPACVCVLGDGGGVREGG